MSEYIELVDLVKRLEQNTSIADELDCIRRAADISIHTHAYLEYWTLQLWCLKHPRDEIRRFAEHFRKEAIKDVFSFDCAMEAIHFLAETPEEVDELVLSMFCFASFAESLEQMVEAVCRYRHDDADLREWIDEIKSKASTRSDFEMIKNKIAEDRFDPKAPGVWILSSFADEMLASLDRRD